MKLCKSDLLGVRTYSEGAFMHSIDSSRKVVSGFASLHG